MGGVDKVDQMLSAYPLERKRQKKTLVLRLIQCHFPEYVQTNKDVCGLLQTQCASGVALSVQCL
ncbi:hypothetical protein J6590_065581 [Homalodisca vitripennis]|nr:hypothetical protein J6590_065581 [Homalodisca vitripennis]